MNSLLLKEIPAIKGDPSYRRKAFLYEGNPLQEKEIPTKTKTKSTSGAHGHGRFSEI